MKKYLFTALSFLPLFAFAETPLFQTINCVDKNTTAKAPVYLTIETKVPNSATGTQFTLGNIVQLKTQPESGVKEPTVYGAITSITPDSDGLILVGSIGTQVKMNLNTGNSLLQGVIKYDPATGKYVGPKRVTDYALVCTLIR